MSLQDDDSGATCGVCGHFDFLPIKCIRCHGVFCGEHIRDHPVPSSQLQCVAAESAAPLAAAPPAAAGPMGNGRRCAVCGAGPGALLPACPVCLRDFCAAHRFHGHEGAPARRSSGPSGPAVAQRSQPLLSTGDDNDDDDDVVAAACAPFVAGAPLRLAPLGYRGAELSATAVVLSAHAAAVASLTVSAGMSVGQMLERWRAAHAAFAGPARLCHIAGSPTGAGIALREIPQSAVARDTAIDGRVVAIVMSEHENENENGATDLRLEQYLFAPRATTRMRSAAARVRMQILMEPKAKMQSPVEPPSRGALPRLTAEESLEPTATMTTTMTTTTTTTTTVTAEANSAWPFRQPPPLDAFVPSNTRANPFGAADVTNSGAVVVVVVVFVADTLLRAPFAPFCMALSSAWPAGRVFDRAVRLVAECAAAVRPVRWRLFDLATQRPVEGQPHALRDGDGLFLGEAFPAELQREMQRLQQLHGRDAAAFAMKRMKSCTTM